MRKQKKPNCYEIVVRGDKGFVLQIFPPIAFTKDFSMAVEEANNFLKNCATMTKEELRISKIQEVYI